MFTCYMALSSALLLALPAAPIEDAPDRLITKHGVELRSEERVFLLFAALNALGYAEETQRKGPPLRAPVFHPIRVEVRDQLRKLKKKKTLEGIRSLFYDNSAEIEVYLEVVLSHQDGKQLSENAKKLLHGAAVLDEFRKEAELVKVFDAIAKEQREHAKALKTRIESDFAKASKIIGKKLRAPGKMVVVPNALDGHGVVRHVRLGKAHFLVVGPGYASAQRAVLETSLRPVMSGFVAKSFGGSYQTHWNVIKASKRISRRYKNGQAYLAETLARSVAFRVRYPKVSKDRDEDFIDDQAKDGLRWTRAVLRVLDAHTSGSLEEALPKLLTKHHP